MGIRTAEPTMWSLWDEARAARRAAGAAQQLGEHDLALMIDVEADVLLAEARQVARSSGLSGEVVAAFIPHVPVHRLAPASGDVRLLVLA